MTTYAADCTTLKTEFVLGETVCAKVENAPGFSIQAFYWSNASNFLVQNSPITTASQDDSFVLPTANTSTIGVFTANNRGTWKITAAGIDDGSPRAIAFITVTNPAAPAADLGVFKFLASGEARVTEGTNVTFNLHVANIGPNAATNVTLTDSTPTNMTLVSIVENAGGAGFSCSGSVCTIASLPKDGSSSFTATYTVASVASDTVSSYSAQVSSDTGEPNNTDNTASGDILITGTNNTPAACTLGCTADIVVDAASGKSGANVTFDAPSTSGSVCNPVTCSSSSGAFFSIGTTVVTCQAATDDSCSFNITVNDTQAPVIGACPTDITVNETSSGSGSAIVNYTTPTATDNSGNVSVTCDQPSGSSFTVAGSPHLVTCTASDEAGLTSSCTFNVSVNGVTGDCSLTTINNITVDSAANACGANVSYTAPVSDGTGSCGPVTCDHPSGSFFPVGTTTVMCTDGSVGTSSFTVTVEDHTAPVPTVANLPDINAQCFIQVNRPTANDACLGTISATTADPLQYDTPGTYVIHWTYEDSAGNTSSQNQNVIIAADGTAPVIVTCATNKTITADSSCATMPDLTTEVEATDNCTEIAISQSVAPGTTLGSGVTTVVITATDNAGNTATCTRTITVIDAIKPVISLTGPSSITVECHTSFTDQGATATDNCDSSVTVTPSSNVNIDVPGTYTINYNATDHAGNAATQVSRTVVVVDTTPPTITAPADSSAFADANCLAPVPDYRPGTVAADSCSSSVTLSQSPAPGTLVGYGPHTVTVTANDGHGNTASDDVVFTVNDNTPPTFTSCPVNLTIEATCPAGAKATYATPTATDNCGVAVVTRTTGPASGSTFPIGTTTVTHVANDGHGNTATCTFTVTVLTPQAVIQNLITSVSASSLTGTQKNGLLAKLNAALTAINSGQQNVACNKLAEFVNSVGVLINNGSLTAVQGNAWISSANNVRNTIGCTNNPCS
jgi:uncharacterized repeat protein (TIGR01451 family)